MIYSPAAAHLPVTAPSAFQALLSSLRKQAPQHCLAMPRVKPVQSPQSIRVPHKSGTYYCPLSRKNVMPHQKKDSKEIPTTAKPRIRSEQQEDLQRAVTLISNAQDAEHPKDLSALEHVVQKSRALLSGTGGNSWARGLLTRSHCSAWSLLCRPSTTTSAFTGMILSLCSFFRTCFSLCTTLLPSKLTSS